MTLEVIRYDPSLNVQWREFLKEAKNGIFLFERSYMEYHADRFVDFSAVALLNGKVVALFPASFRAEDAVAFSHAGLTYGGIVLRRDVRGALAIEIVEACLEAFRAWGADELVVKLLPSFLSTYPAEEVHYALWRKGFVVESRMASSVIPLANALPLNTTRRQLVAKAAKTGVTISETPSLTDFHDILRAVLDERHDAAPVHSLAELEYLASAFPDNIRLYTAVQGGQTLAGSLIFDFKRALHTQYLAASPQGRELAALDLVIKAVIDDAHSRGKAYMSFGTSTEGSGHILNAGLMAQKESFGARTVVLETMRGAL